MFRKILWGIIPTLLLGVVACSDDTSSDSFTASPVYGESCSSVIGESSSSVAGVSSSDAGENAVSSSQEILVSSSSQIAPTVSSSSVGVLVDSTACLWNAKKGEYIVKTGFDPDDKHGAGYWYSYSDNDDGGMSHVEWDAECLNDGTDCMQHLVDECGGICGKMYWDKGNAPEAVVGVAFNVAGFEDPAADVAHPLSADISDWGGICVTYSSDLNLYVRLGVGEDAEVIAELGKSENLVEKCLTWADFDKDAEGENPMPAAEAAKKIKNIKFGKISGESMSGHFTIASVGKYVASGACNVGLVNSNPSSSSVSSPVLSSSSVSGDCADPKSVSEMWDGSDASWDARVITGADNGTETSGYWFSFGNDMDGVGSVNWPGPLGHEYTLEEDIFGYCKGVCGEMEFAKEGYLGIGFHVAGVAEPMDGNSPATKANISSWGGLCVTYASESDLDVVLAYAQNDGFGNLSRMPKVTLPKSMDLKTVCLDWDNFMSVYSEVSTTSMTSILFAVQGEANAKSRINIRGLGKYSEKTNFCSTGEDPFVSGKKGLVIK